MFPVIYPGTRREKRYGIGLLRAGEGRRPAAVAHSRHVRGGVGLQVEQVVPVPALFAPTVEGLHEMANGDGLRTKRHGHTFAGSRALPPLGVRHA